MRDNDLPIMRLHIGDYLRTTLAWPPIAKFVYVELLMVQWTRGHLPVAPDQLRMLVPGITDDDWCTAWPLIEPELPVDGPGRQNHNIAEDRERTLRIRKSRQDGASKTNARRWGVIDGGRDGD